MNILFNSERYFTLFDIIISHGQLLLRSQKNNALPNIDIIFFDTFYIQVPYSLYGIKILKQDDFSALPNYPEVKEYLNRSTKSLFEIQTRGGSFYIAASFFKAFENDFDFSKSSLNQDVKGKLLYSTV